MRSNIAPNVLSQAPTTPIYKLGQFLPLWRRRDTTSAAANIESTSVAGSGMTRITKSRNTTPSSPPKKILDGSDGQPSAAKSPVGELGSAALVAMGKPVASA